MLIEITETTVCDGRNVLAGDKIKTDKRQGQLLINMGKAIEAKETLSLKDEPKSVKKSKRKSKDKEE